MVWAAGFAQPLRIRMPGGGTSALMATTSLKLRAMLVCVPAICLHLDVRAYVMTRRTAAGRQTRTIIRSAGARDVFFFDLCCCHLAGARELKIHGRTTRQSRHGGIANSREVGEARAAGRPFRLSACVGAAPFCRAGNRTLAVLDRVRRNGRMADSPEQTCTVHWLLAKEKGGRVGWEVGNPGARSLCLTPGWHRPIMLSEVEGRWNS